MTEGRGGKVIGRIEGERFVPIAEVDEGKQHELSGEGYAQSDAIADEVDRRMQRHDEQAAEQKVDEQLAMLAHVLAAIDPAELSLEQLERLGEVGNAFMELWLAGLRSRVRR